MEWNRLVPELVVQDYERSKQFYLDAFGFTLRFERPENRFGYFDLHGAQVMLLERPGAAIYRLERPGPLGKGLHFQVEVDALDPVLERLQRLDIELTAPVVTSWYRADAIEHGQKEFFVADPDGYLFRFCEYLGERPVRV